MELAIPVAITLGTLSISIAINLASTPSVEQFVNASRDRP